MTAVQDTGINLSYLQSISLPVPHAAEVIHVFDILARVSNDRELQEGVHRLFQTYNQAVTDCRAKLRDYAGQWSVVMTNSCEIERKTEELI